MQRSFVDDNDMGTGTIPAYMTSTLPGFNQQWSPFSPNALHHKQSLNAASPLAANTSGQGMDEDGSEGSDSYVEMDEFASPNEIPKKKYSKRRKSRKSSQKHSGQREPRAAPDIPKKPSRNSPLSASPQANPYLEPTGMSMRRDVSNMFIASSKEMTLGEFVTKHQHEFPVRVRVSRGFYGMTDRWSISEGEYFNIHFVKYTKVVSATDGGSGHYNIPVNSAVEFASLYAPDGKVESGLQGFSFTTARDVTIQSKVPQILRALKSCIRPGVPAASVNANELLVVKKVKKPFFGSRVLHCTDLLTGEKKALPANCVGQFTTKPFLVRLFLPEVIQHLTLPGKFVMFLNPDTSCDLPEDLFSSAITLSHCSIETSLVATQLESTDPRDNPLLEIPIDLDIGVELVTPKAEELAQLFEDTQEIYANFDISHVKSIPSNAASIDVNPDVTKAVKTTRLGKENMGIQLQQPPRYSLAGSRDYNLTLEPLMPKPVASSHHHKKSRKTHSVDEGERVAVLESQVCQMAEQIKVLRRQLKKLTAEQQQMQQGMVTITDDIQELQTRRSTEGPPLKLPPKPKTMRPPPQTREEEITQNREYLSALTLPQVMELLDRLRMTQYQAIFHKHRITGHQLVQMHEPELARLGIQPGEHSNLLMNIINGFTSTLELLKEC